MEQDKNGNHFCIAHSSLSIASFRGIWRGIWKRKCFFVQFQFIFFAEIVCNTINFRNFGIPLLVPLLFRLHYKAFWKHQMQDTQLFFYWVCSDEKLIVRQKCRNNSIQKVKFFGHWYFRKHMPMPAIIINALGWFCSSYS